MSEAVEPGYKKTDVGVIPEEWELSTAFKVCELVVDCKNRTPLFVDFSDYAVARTPNVRDGKFVFEDLKYTDLASYVEWTARAIPQLGDILITREAPLGEVCTVPHSIKICLGQRMMLYRPDNLKIYSGYLLFSLRSKSVRDNLVRKIGGSTVGHAKVDDIKFLQLPIPPLPEQRAIASALADVDALLDSLEKLHIKKRQLKQAAMQELLTGKTRLEGFEGEWEEKRLGELLSIRHGKNQSEVESDSGLFPILATGGQIGLSAKYLYNMPSVLIGRKGTINRPQYMDKPFWTVDTLFYSEIIGSNSAKYLYYIFLSIDWMQYNEASGVPSLNARTIENVEIFCPTSAEQKAIAAILSEMDDELETLEERLTKTRDLKQGMMQELLTGRTRLI